MQIELLISTLGMKIELLILTLGALFVCYGIGYVVGFHSCFDYLQGELDKFKMELEDEDEG